MPLKNIYSELYSKGIGMEAVGKATHRDEKGRLKEHIVEIWVRPKKEEVNKMHGIVGEFESKNGITLKKVKIERNGRVFYGFAKKKKPNLDKFVKGRNAAIIASAAKLFPSKLVPSDKKDVAEANGKEQGPPRTLMHKMLGRLFLNKMKKIKKG